VVAVERPGGFAGAALLGEPIALAAVAGGLAILLGVWMIERR
jgi:drug/metabolite transporter (DMT)-like permease